MMTTRLLRKKRFALNKILQNEKRKKLHEFVANVAKFELFAGTFY